MSRMGRLSKNLFLFRFISNLLPPQGWKQGKGGNKADDKGSILVVSIWMLIIFSIFAAGLYKIGLSQINLAQRLEALTLSQHAAVAVCKYVRWELEQDETIYDSLYELQQQKYRDLGFTRVTYTLIDEESKIDINIMPEEVLGRLPGINEDVAKTIAESLLRPFCAKEELLLIDGIDEDSFSQFSKFITAHSNGRVNINTASQEVLGSLGLDESLVNVIMSFRGGIDGKEGTEDDGVFETTQGILDTLRSFTGLFEAQEKQLLSVISNGWLGVQGENFLLSMKTEVFGKPARSYDVIIDTKADKITQWMER